MQTIFLILIALVWAVGACVRIYKQARYFQIEEYMNLRYLRWWLSARERLITNRTLMAVIVGAGLAALLGEAPDSPLPGIIGLAASIVAVIPPDEGEIKKAFRGTRRAIRLLGAGFVLVVVSVSILAWIVSRAGIESGSVQVVAVMAVGWLVFLAAPLFLTAGNVLLYPVEAYMRRRFIASARAVMKAVNPIVIGITGSYGKTTTKHFVTDILNGRYRAYATPKSYNTLMGVCLAINNDLAQDYSIDYFVVEMGAYVRGEIERIAALTPPRISIVTEVGPQHLERFGSIQAVVEAKYEIIKALPPDGVGVFNWDNPHVRAMFERGYPDTRLAVSKMVSPVAVPEDGPRFIASEIEETLQGLRFTVTDAETGASERFVTQIVGEHNVTNILLATAVAVYEGMSLKDIAFRVGQLKPAESRLTTHIVHGITIINDAYSANPAGAVSALKVLGLHMTGRRLLVTPGMVELGELQDDENRKLGAAIAQYATDVILVGTQQTHAVRLGLDDAGFPAERLHVVAELREAMSWYQTNLEAGDTVLFLNDLPDTY